MLCYGYEPICVNSDYITNLIYDGLPWNTNIFFALMARSPNLTKVTAALALTDNYIKNIPQYDDSKPFFNILPPKIRSYVLKSRKVETAPMEMCGLKCSQVSFYNGIFYAEYVPK
jgi:hypothetical protein